MQTLTIISPDFQNNGTIPEKFTCQGQDLIPILKISGIGKGIKSFVIIIDDPDAPSGTWVHFVGYDIKVNGDETQTIFENNKIDISKVKIGINNFKTKVRGGPCPPKGSGTHRYIFKIYGINIKELKIKGNPTKQELIDAIQSFTIAKGEIIGKYRID